MEIHLLPGVGVGLPPPACQLAFGTEEHDVVATLTAVGDVHEAFVCGLRAETPASGRRLALGDVTMTFGFFGTPGVLETVAVGRSADDSTGRAAVVFDDVDLFDWPADEVVAALRDGGHEVHHPGNGNVWIDGELWLLYQTGRRPTPAGRKPRWEPPGYLNFACLYSPRRH